MSVDLVYSDEAAVLRWIEGRLGLRLRSDARAIGLARGGKLIAAVGYDTFGTSGCFVHIAALPGVWWAGRRYFEILIPLAAFPFVQCGFRRVSFLIEAGNYRSRRLVERLGARQEGTMRCAGATGGDLILYGMLREECGWLAK